MGSNPILITKWCGCMHVKQRAQSEKKRKKKEKEKKNRHRLSAWFLSVLFFFFFVSLLGSHLPSEQKAARSYLLMNIGNDPYYRRRSMVAHNYVLKISSQYNTKYIPLCALCKEVSLPQRRSSPGTNYQILCDRASLAKLAKNRGRENS